MLKDETGLVIKETTLGDRWDTCVARNLIMGVTTPRPLFSLIIESACSSHRTEAKNEFVSLDMPSKAG